MVKTVFSEVEKRGHEQVVFFHFPQVGLKAIVGIHNTALGPALGGCRMRVYTDESQALDDCLRLSEGMTYKSSIAGLNLGGGKSVLIADPKMSEGRRELFLKFGECLNSCTGRYITAEDMGTSVADIMVMREVTKYAAGYSRELGGSGDPSPWTARGCYQGVLAACERTYGSKDLKGKKIALQGAGHVGMYLIEHLVKAGAQVWVSDTNREALDIAKSRFGAEIVDVEKIYDLPMDVFSPCAIGQTVNHDTLKRLNCKVIAGAANNQLTDPSVYKTIEDKKIMYCPDFVINGGGVISVAGEYNDGGWKESWVAQKVDNIFNTIHKVAEESEKRKAFPEVVALELAKERVKAAEEAKRIR